MFCEAYRKALTDASAGAGVLEARAQTHLASCEECAAAFAKEQALFAAIDAGVSRLVNSDVPPSLLPRVREVVAAERALKRRFFSAWTWTAAAAVALALAIVIPGVLEHRRAPDAQPASAKAAEPAASRSKTAAAVHSGQSIQARTASRRASAKEARTASEPEVLVPPEAQGALLAYAKLLQNRPDLAQALIDSDNSEAKSIEPLKIAAIETTDLQIEPLVGDSDNRSK